MITPAAPPPTSAARRDLLALATLGLLAFAAAWRFDLFDRLVAGLQSLTGRGGEALVVAVLVLAFALKLYAWRRWREARRALAAHREAEAALRAREAQLGLLTRQLPAFLWTTDAELRLTTFAGGGFRRDGIDPRGRVGLTVGEFFGVDDPTFPPLAAHRRALGGEPADYPLHRDGRAYEVRVEPLRDAAGAIVGTLGLGVDVTARERAARALRDSEARFRAIFAGAAIGIGLADLERRPLMVNPALTRFTGRDGIGGHEHGFGSSTHPEDAVQDQALYAELVAGERDHYQLEKRYLRPDGATVWGRLTTSLVRDTTGAPQYAIGMVEDITARVAAEAALRAREARYRAVVAQAAEGIFLFDAASRRIAEANPALRRLLGYTEADLATLTLYDIVAHDRASIDAHIAAIAAAGYAPIGERDYRRADGATIPVEVSATALRGDGGTLCCVVVRDIGARRAAEAALRASETRLRAVVENAPVILFTLDAAGVITFAAGRGLAALGHAPGAIIGYPIFGDGPSPPAIGDYARRALAGETVEGHVTVGELVFATHYAPLGDAAGTVAGVIGVATDVTALTATRRRLLASREAAQAELARELHDGPVQELYGVAFHLETLADALPDDTGRARLAAGLAALEGVSGTLRAISGELRPPTLAPFGLAAAIGAHARRVGEARPDLAIHLDLAPGEPALAEPGRLALFRIVQEALRNAAQHAGARAVWVRLGWDAATITAEVRDDGAGFAPPPRWAALVERGHLGLAGATERAEALGGRLTVESAPGRGTVVRAVVPRPAG